MYYFEVEVSSAGLLSDIESSEWFVALKQWIRLAEPEDAQSRILAMKRQGFSGFHSVGNSSTEKNPMAW